MVEVVIAGAAPLAGYRSNKQMALRRYAPSAMFGLALLVLLTGLGLLPVSRSQEARVMLGAQAMTAQRLHQWLIPQLNGKPRFQKPPLATWLAAISFSILGVSEFAGRLPNAIAGWITLAIVFHWARIIAGQRAGFMAAGGLLGSFYFFRFSRLAETDAAAMPWVTLAFFAIWCAARPGAGESSRARISSAALLHLAALASGLATMAKGGPGTLPWIYLLVLAIAHRSMLATTQFFRSGAVATFALIVLPWFAYIWVSPEARRVLAYEASVLVRGGGHAEQFYRYFVWIAYGCLPWTGFGLVALQRAFSRFRMDVDSRDLLLAVVSVLVPLLLMGQKQPHYLTSLIPILFVLTAVQIECMLNDPLARRFVGKILFGTIVVVAVIALSLLPITFWQPPGARLPMLVLSAVLLAGTAVGIIRLRSRGTWQGLVAFGLAAPIAMLVVNTLVTLAGFQRSDPRALAGLIRQQIGKSPLAWWGEDESLALTYYCGQVMPCYDGDPHTAAPEPPRDVVLVDLLRSDTDELPPEGFMPIYAAEFGERRVVVFAPTSTSAGRTGEATSRR